MFCMKLSFSISKHSCTCSLIYSKNWVLTAVIPSDNLVYLMDPYKRVAYEDEWKTVVNQ